MGYARIQTEPPELQSLLDELRQEEVGGVTLYLGTVRGRDGDRRVDALTYEAHAEMAQGLLERIRAETIRRFRLIDAIVVHRIGRFAPGECVLVVALAGAHRAETFDAVRFLMDELKREVPIWKQEEGPEGRAWVLGEKARRVPS